MLDETTFRNGHRKDNNVFKKLKTKNNPSIHDFAKKMQSTAAQFMLCLRAVKMLAINAD